MTRKVLFQFLTFGLLSHTIRIVIKACARLFVCFGFFICKQLIIKIILQPPFRFSLENKTVSSENCQEAEVKLFKRKFSSVCQIVLIFKSSTTKFLQFSVQTVPFFKEKRKEGCKISLLPAYIWKKKNKQMRVSLDQYSDRMTEETKLQKLK